VNSSFKVNQAKFSNLNRRLENSSVQSSLKRGFVILKDPSNDVLGSLSSAVAQKNIKACFYDGEIELENKKVNLNGRKE
jgi:exonuclease VII large subunit